jgi:hypothetical protein
MLVDPKTFPANITLPDRVKTFLGKLLTTIFIKIPDVGVIMRVNVVLNNRTLPSYEKGLDFSGDSADGSTLLPTEDCREIK